MSTHTEERERFGNGTAEEVQDPALAMALRNFRDSVHAWGDAALASARPLPVPAQRVTIWRKVAATACSCLLVTGMVTGGLYERHQQQGLARQAALRQAEQARQAAEARARETEELMAQIDRDVSRQVPAAMEPLAQFMTEDGGQ